MSISDISGMLTVATSLYVIVAITVILLSEKLCRRLIRVLKALPGRRR